MYYFCTVSILYAYIRIREPTVWKFVKQGAGMCDNKSNNEPRLSTVNEDLVDNLSAFLNSTLNVELVYSILSGVTNLLDTP
jgi:hypothetical protein